MARQVVRRSTLLAVIGAMLASIGIAACALPALARDYDVDGVPVPDTAKITGPAASDPQAHHRFSGTWVGVWGGSTKHVLVIESVMPDGRASLIEAWGDNPPFNIRRGWRRLTGTIADETLTVAGDVRLDYTLLSATTISAGWQRGDARAAAFMRKVELPALIGSGAQVDWGTGQSVMLETALAEGGKQVRLETVIYRPAGNGPFPLIVLNHGSTGNGDRPETFKNTFRMPELAQFFVEKGWLVAHPQRRGRGKSDGLYDEGFWPDRSRYACDTSLSLAGAERALVDIEAAVAALRKWPNVQKGAFIMGGVSRGGIISIAYAGRHPGQIKGVLNFVGGWLGEQCSVGAHVNGTLFRGGGAKYAQPTLWLYGDNDPFYSLLYSRSNFAVFQIAGGKGRMLEFKDVPGGNGHRVHWWLKLWQQPIQDYLQTIGATDGK